MLEGQVMFRLIGAALLAVVTVGPPAAAETKHIMGVFFRGCEEACEGFRAAIAESEEDIEVIIRDIAQDRSLLPGLVQEARALEVDLVLTWGTSVTLGIVGPLDSVHDPRFLNDIPVVFTVVADPFGARVAEGFEGSGRKNLTGTFNRVPEAVNIEVIRQYDPSFTKLGLIYNSNEENSLIKFHELSELAPTLDVELVAVEISGKGSAPPEPSAIPGAVHSLSEQGVRWMYLGSSSFLRQNGGLYTASAVEADIGVVSPYEGLVRDAAALLSVAARYEDVGRLAATQALRILRDGVGPGDLPIARMTDFAYVVNIDVAKALDRYPPFAFLQIAETVARE